MLRWALKYKEGYLTDFGTNAKSIDPEATDYYFDTRLISAAVLFSDREVAKKFFSAGEYTADWTDAEKLRLKTAKVVPVEVSYRELDQGEYLWEVYKGED